MNSRHGEGELTPRELEILKLIDQGFTNEKIAELHNIEVGIVKKNEQNILQKLEVNNRYEAAIFFT